MIKEYLSDLTKIDKTGFFKYAINHGRMFLKDHSLPVDQRIMNEVYPRSRQCYWNAYRAALSFKMEYWVGWYLPEFEGKVMFPMEHAFNVKDGHVLDLTAQHINTDVAEWYGLLIPPVYFVKYHKSIRGILFEYYAEKEKIRDN